MRIEQKQVEAFTIFGAPVLDAVTVLMTDYGGGRGHLIVECYGLAWSAYWGAMGDGSLRQFVASVSADYIANRMWPRQQRRLKRDYDYLLRIVEAVQTAVKQQAPARADAEAIAAVPELKDKHAVVLYFETDGDRDELVALIQQAKPGMRAVNL